MSYLFSVINLFVYIYTTLTYLWHIFKNNIDIFLFSKLIFKFFCVKYVQWINIINKMICIHISMLIRLINKLYSCVFKFNIAWIRHNTISQFDILGCEQLCSSFYNRHTSSNPEMNPENKNRTKHKVPITLKALFKPKNKQKKFLEWLLVFTIQVIPRINIKQLSISPKVTNPVVDSSIVRDSTLKTTVDYVRHQPKTSRPISG